MTSTTPTAKAAGYNNRAYAAESDARRIIADEYGRLPVYKDAKATEAAFHRILRRKKVADLFAGSRLPNPKIRCKHRYGGANYRPWDNLCTFFTAGGTAEGTILHELAHALHYGNPRYDDGTTRASHTLGFIAALIDLYEAVYGKTKARPLRWACAQYRLKTVTPAGEIVRIRRTKGKPGWDEYLK